MMIRYIIKNIIDLPEDLKNFYLNDYKFDAKISSEKDFFYKKYN